MEVIYYLIRNVINEDSDTLPVFSIKTKNQFKPLLEGLITLLGILVTPVSIEQLNEIVGVYQDNQPKKFISVNN